MDKEDLFDMSCDSLEDVEPLSDLMDRSGKVESDDLTLFLKVLCGAVDMPTA